MEARLAKAKSTAVKNESRDAKLAQGWAQKGFLLPPRALADLAAAVKRDGGTEAEAVARALAQLAKGDSVDAIPNSRLIKLVAKRLRPEFD